MYAGKLLQFGCSDVQPAPPEASSGVRSGAAGVFGYTVAWKGLPVNKLIMWGSGGLSTDILASLKASLPDGGSISNVAQISAQEQHALVLKADGTVVAGYTPEMKKYALPPVGKGRIARVSAGFRYSLGVRLSP
jgi:hypothetical protein